MLDCDLCDILFGVIVDGFVLFFVVVNDVFKDFIVVLFLG